MKINTGLWKATSKGGLNYYQGKATIEGKEYRIALFNNTNKLKDTSPDLNLVIEDSEEKIVQQPVAQTQEEDPYEAFGNSITVEEVDKNIEETLPF